MEHVHRRRSEEELRAFIREELTAPPVRSIIARMVKEAIDGAESATVEIVPRKAWWLFGRSKR